MKLTAVALILSIGLMAGCRSVGNGRSDTAQAEAIEIEVWNPMGTQEAVTRTENAPAIAVLLSLLGEPREEVAHHRCLSAGRLRLVRDDRTVDVFEMLPGHDHEYYEYRHKGKTCRVDRDRFVKALRNAGVKNIPGVDK